MVVEEGASQKQQSNDTENNQEVIESIEIKLEITPIIQEENNLGWLKRTTKDVCPECGEKKLQIRVRELESVEEGEDYLKDIEYLYCPGCKFEQEIEPKRKRKKMKMREEADFNDGTDNKRRKSTPYRNAKDLRRSNKKSFR